MALDLSKQRLLMTTGLFLFMGLVLYAYVMEIIVLFGVFIFAWYVYDLIEQYTKECVDPTGKYVFITGCDTGFGLAAAKSIRDVGFHVIAGCYDDQSKGALELKALPWVKKVEVVSLDVTSEASVNQAAKEVKDICGDQGLWAVINNAGIHACGPVEVTTMESYHRVSAVNLFGAIRVCKAVLPAVRQAQGRVINITSERGFNPWKDNSNYCLTKAGLETFSAVLRKEMERFNVKVITIAPGYFPAATGIISEKMTEALLESALKGHSQLSLQDQNLYKKEELMKSLDCSRMRTEEIQTPDSVVKAYIDACMNLRPKDCYLIHGRKRQSMDGLILMARIRPFIPMCMVPWVEKAMAAVFM